MKQQNFYGTKQKKKLFFSRQGYLLKYLDFQMTCRLLNTAFVPVFIFISKENNSPDPLIGRMN